MLTIRFKDKTLLSEGRSKNRRQKSLANDFGRYVMKIIEKIIENGSEILQQTSKGFYVKFPNYEFTIDVMEHMQKSGNPQVKALYQLNNEGAVAK